MKTKPINVLCQGTTLQMKPKFESGQTVWLDFDLSNRSKVEVVEQTPKRLFTSVKSPDSSYTWTVMTYRLSTI